MAAPRLALPPSSTEDPVAARVVSTSLATSWLTMMRWHAIGGQALAISLAAFVLHVRLPLPPLYGCVIASAASNVALSFAARRSPNLGSAVVFATLVFDIFVLTLQLALSGGASNPFAIFYLLQILLAGLVLPTPWVTGTTAAAVASYASLFLWPSNAHFLSQWVPFFVLAVFVAETTTRTANALRGRHAELLRKQRIAAHGEKLASLSTLAAGAAHELGSPLGTISVASEDLEALIRESPAEAIEDARVIRAEIARCREIVHRMNARAGQLLGELPEPTSTTSVLSNVCSLLSAAERERLVVETDDDEAIECPARGLARVLANLVSNALQASEASGAPVLVSARRIDDNVQFVIDDRGTGIAPDVRERIGEPFVTTKDPGRGMGLGLFLSFAFAELCSGRLELSARVGGGTTAVLELPRLVRMAA